MFKTKRAQSEIITTVLIILLVLAAIIIVWQVVSSTINTGKENIEQTSQCIGINVDLVSAVEAKKTCQYDTTGTGPCNDIIVSAGNPCPLQSGVCNIPDGEYITPSNIKIRRDSVEPENKPVDVIVLVNGKRIKNGASLQRFDSKSIIITNAVDDLGADLKIGDEISVAYTIDGVACPNDPQVLGKVTA